MKMKISYLLVVLPLLVHLQAYSQTIELTVTDKDVVMIPEKEEQLGIENSYYLKNGASNIYDSNFYMTTNYNFYKEWVIFYSKSKKDTASYSKVRGDTCEIIQRWENKTIKAKEIYVKGNLKYLEYYCENGHVISKGDAFITSNDTMYYCNGNYRITYNRRTGVQTFWNEDGKISMTGIFVNQVSVGLWKKYDENGNIIWYLYYKDGKEIYSGKEYPQWLREN